ncbi:MAG: aminoacetone oxidase family FAD-binding enzyme [Patescibacteria group bacterium]
MKANKPIDKGEIWDVAVIGGGPAGMMAAGRAAELGAKVIIIEKNKRLGEKLLITGGGRCNVLNGEMNTRKLLSKYGENDKFLFSAFSQFSSKEALDFFHSHNMPTIEEAEKRMFPETQKSSSVWNVMLEYMRAHNVTVRSNSPVVRFMKNNEKIEAAVLKNGEEIKAKSFILATGGKSRPETGSTGDGFLWLNDFGHTVIPPNPALVPITVKDAWVKSLMGVSISPVKVTVLQNNVKQEVKKGKILFTHFGLSGPTILNMSFDISELLKFGGVTISLDIFPTHDHSAMNTLLQELFKEYSNKKIKNSIGKIIPSALLPTIFLLSNISGDIFCRSVTREQRLSLITLLKGIPIQVKGLLGVEKAIITSGGVSLNEVDFKTMRSRIYPNLYLVGDILNIDRPSGGYSLQLCWTSGYVAGSAAAV